MKREFSKERKVEEIEKLLVQNKSSQDIGSAFDIKDDLNIAQHGRGSFGRVFE